MESSKPEEDNSSQNGISNAAEIMTTEEIKSPPSGISPVTASNFRKDRSPSPGIARRVVTDVTCEPTGEPTETVSASNTDAVIDDLTEKLANSLLEKPSAQPQKQQYVSMNQKLAERRQQELNDQLVQNHHQAEKTENPVAIHTSASLTQLSHEDIDMLGPTANGSLNGQINGAADISSDILIPQSDNVMDGSILNISKPTTLNPSVVPNTQTLFDTSNGIDSLTPASENSGAHEVDILTAMSGEPTPNSLPLVTDGISDGEISSDSEVEGVPDDPAGLQIRQRVCFFISH